MFSAANKCTEELVRDHDNKYSWRLSMDFKGNQNFRESSSFFRGRY